VQGPQNRTLYIGSTVNFRCTTEGLSDIDWKYAATAGGASMYVFDRRGRNDGLFDERFVKTANGSTCILTILNVHKSDAGSYICRERTVGSDWTARLTVIGQSVFLAMFYIRAGKFLTEPKALS